MSNHGKLEQKMEKKDEKIKKKRRRKKSVIIINILLNWLLGILYTYNYIDNTEQQSKHVLFL